MKIKIAIIDERASFKIQRRLAILGFKVITLPAFDKLGEAVRSHTDMLLARLGKSYISFADYADEHLDVFTDLSDLLRNTGACFGFASDDVRAEYPYDARLNVLPMGELLFCKADTVSEYLKKAAESQGMKIVNVKQGYPACTVLKLNDTSAITADAGMQKALTENKIRVTLIENGCISLPPHPYGFIGGCSGVYENCVYFLGNVTRHPSFKEIEAAISAEGMSFLSLSDEMLTDLGGILFAEGELN